MSNTAILLLSGGIDSTTVLAGLSTYGVSVTAIIADYGQTLANEVEIAVRNCERWGAKPVVVPLPMRGLTDKCALLKSKDLLPVGRTQQEIESDGTPDSYVPFRNGILFAWAAAYGEGHGIEHIYGGCNGLLSGNYWDDTAEFAQAMQVACDIGTDPSYKPKIHVPFASTPKSKIVRIGLRHGLDYSHTYSCYAGTPQHCGRCDSCVQRAEAMQANGLTLEGNKA